MHAKASRGIENSKASSKPACDLKVQRSALGISGGRDQSVCKYALPKTRQRWALQRRQPWDYREPLNQLLHDSLLLSIEIYFETLFHIYMLILTFKAVREPKPAVAKAICFELTRQWWSTTVSNVQIYITVAPPGPQIHHGSEPTSWYLSWCCELHQPACGLI